MHMTSVHMHVMLLATAQAVYPLDMRGRTLMSVMPLLTLTSGSFAGSLQRKYGQGKSTLQYLHQSLRLLHILRRHLRPWQA